MIADLHVDIEPKRSRQTKGTLEKSSSIYWSCLKICKKMARSHPRMVCTACVRHLYIIRDCESSAFLKHVTFLWESSQCRSSLFFSGLDLGCNEKAIRESQGGKVKCEEWYIIRKVEKKQRMRRRRNCVASLTISRNPECPWWGCKVLMQEYFLNI